MLYVTLPSTFMDFVVFAFIELSYWRDISPSYYRFVLVDTFPGLTYYSFKGAILSS